MGWMAFGPNEFDHTLTIDSTTARSGRASLLVRRVAGAEGTWVAVQQMVDVTRWRGQRVRLSVSARPSTGSTATLFAFVSGIVGDSAAVLLSAEQGTVAPEFSAPTWRRGQMTFEVPPSAFCIRFGIQVAGQGPTWVDDFVLERVSPEVPASVAAGPAATYGTRPAAGQCEGASMHETPRNLSFEGR